ncbi:transcriptional regulator [Porphyromonas macacae]|uniref:Winged helix DNA-binding domain-containing protein n=1 Tax=Porphyromonas macacae TaxID=28115 RepID=A0A379DIW2_9PORP|nr:transcriptional regulator [Porphyromonas macacae]KGN99875.1 transcriptional regulator [Porphyromonas macacae]SUB78276.1 Uncharacterised protein [Porphyromonas macacae]
MLEPLNPLFMSELRLAIMSILIAVEEADFLYIKEQTGATAGNISVQLDKLSSAGYIEIEKGFSGKRTRTTCRVTEEGSRAFQAHFEVLKTYFDTGSK